jgi:hypothetical protein
MVSTGVRAAAVVTAAGVGLVAAAKPNTLPSTTIGTPTAARMPTSRTRAVNRRARFGVAGNSGARPL